jgi:hypothetical protein
MSVITFVQGVLLAAIIATWMWTWWWNRYVVTDEPEPDYTAAMRVFTLMLQESTVPLFARRQQIVRAVIDVGNGTLGRELTISEINRLTSVYQKDEAIRLAKNKTISKRTLMELLLPPWKEQQ